MTGHIFISYARQDGREYASRLDSDLQKIGFHTWRDTRDIDPAQDFSAEIENGIEKAACVALCITPDSKRSDSFVRREIQYAQIIKKPVIPLRFADIPPHVPVVNNEWIDFFKGWEPAFERLCTILKQPIAEPRPTSAPLDDPFRDYLNTLYQNIVRYLNHTVFSLITLNSQSTPQAVNTVEKKQVLPMAFFAMAGLEQNNNLQIRFNNFQESFDQYRSRILLLGEPGAGKTTTLFAFARDQVVRRLEDPNLPLPILAPVATWDAQNQTPLADWLAQTVPTLNRESIIELIEKKKVLLMLDGLDELGGEREDEKTKEHYDPRLRFVNIIPPYNQVVVSCRVKDYGDMKKTISLEGAVTLQPLNDEQMREYLRDLPDLWIALDADRELVEVARTPLLLSLFTFAFRELPEEAKRLSDLKQGDLRDKIFETYVKRRYEREIRKPYANIPFTLDQIYQVLGKVAIDNVRSFWVTENVFDFEAFSKALDRDSIDKFTQLMIELHIIVLRDNNSFRFIHLLLRDYFAFVQAVQYLSEDKTDMRRRAANALGRLGDSRAIEPLIAILKDKTQKDAIRMDSILALGKLKAIQACDILLATLEDANENDSVRYSAASAVARLNDPRVFESLLIVLQSKNEDPFVRYSAANSLGMLRDMRAFNPLLNIFEDISEDGYLRGAAAEALGKLGDLHVLDVFINALSERDSKVRRSAVIALGELGVSSAVPAITHLLQNDHEDFVVQNSALEALKQIGTSEALAVVEEWRKKRNNL